MSKYWLLYTLSLTKTLTYRLNFAINRIRNIVVLLMFYSLWKVLTGTTGAFAGFTQTELYTYVFAAHIIRAFTFGQQSLIVPEEINHGFFSSYLTRPFSHFIFCYLRELADKTISGISAIVEVVIASLVVHFHFTLQLGVGGWALFLLLLLISHILYSLFLYALNLVTFWSHEYGGQRFLFDWFFELASGGFFPLAILSPVFVRALSATPATFLVYNPIMFLLGRISVAEVPILLGIGLLWIVVGACIARFMWQRGLRHYTGYGI